jgi:hypothetical protein
LPKGVDVMNRRQLAAWAGMIGPMLFVAIFTLEGWFRPGYHPFAMFVSVLWLGPRGWIQIVNFVVFGVLFLVFARGVAAEFQDGKASRAGPMLFTIIAIGYLASGPFVMDPVATRPDQMSLHGTLHGIFGGVVFSLMPVSCFVFLRRFREDPQWRSLEAWTLTAGTIIAAAVVLLSVATKLPAARTATSEWVGLIQRTAVLTYSIWLFTFALGLRRRRKQNGEGGTPGPPGRAVEQNAHNER